MSFFEYKVHELIQAVTTSLNEWGFSYDGSKIEGAARKMAEVLGEEGVEDALDSLDCWYEDGQLVFHDDSRMEVLEMIMLHTAIAGFAMEISPDWVEDLFSTQVNHIDRYISDWTGGGGK